jgi:hypothetical protein
LGDDGVDRPADIVRLDRQLTAEAAIDKNAKFDLGRPAEVEQRIEGGPDGAACPKDVIDKDDLFVLDRKRDLGFIEFMQTFTNVVAIERDIQFAITDGIGLDKGSQLADNAIGKVDPARLNADEYSVLEVKMVLEQLIGQTLDRQGQLLLVEDDLHEAKNNGKMNSGEPALRKTKARRVGRRAYLKQIASLFVAAKLVQNGQAQLAERTTGDRSTVIAEDQLHRVDIVAYLRAVFEAAGAAAGAVEAGNVAGNMGGIVTVADLRAKKELLVGIITGADNDGDMAIRNLIGIARAVIDGFAEEVGVTCSYYTSELFGEGIFPLNFAAKSK